ncbi:MAG: tetratricopeptide repeat protein [Flavobacterium sp.]
MKQLFTILAFAFLTTSFGQTADEYLKSGIEKQNAKDYEGAIKDYSKAIKLDKDLKVGYFNRGVCEMGLNDLKSAKKDFDKTIGLDAQFVKAFYSRATVYINQEKYKESLPDLDKTIELDQKFPNALMLRGQMRFKTGNKNGACEDFNQAKEIGEKRADKYLSGLCGNKQQGGESFALHWPENENWKIGSNQENGQMTMIEFIHSNETFENWTEIGTCIAYKNTTNIPMDKAMNMMFEGLEKDSPKAKLTFIEKDEKAEYPWILFTIETTNSKDDKTPESQLWYIVQGKHALYSNFRAVKKDTIPTELKDKWIPFFKSGKVVYQRD